MLTHRLDAPMRSAYAPKAALEPGTATQPVGRWYPPEEALRASAADTARGKYLPGANGMIYRPMDDAQKNAPTWVGWTAIGGTAVAVAAPFIHFFVPSPLLFGAAGLGLFAVAGALWLGKRAMMA